MAENPRWIAYYRVSTDRQGRSGLGLDAQRTAVGAYLASAGGELALEFTEVESGRKADRPELLRAMTACRRLKVPLLIARLDRLSRNVAFIANLMESGVDFRAVDMPEASRFTIHILAAVAEHEREMISKRTRLALQEAKKRGVKLGNPNIQSGAASRANVAEADRFAETVWPFVENMILGGGTYRGIARELNARNIKTRTGKSWTGVHVRNLVRRKSIILL